MTGQHPHEIGVWDNQDELKSDIPTFAHAFHSADYDTVLSGRMHFVGADQRHGFAKRLIGDVSPTAYITAGWQLDKVVGDLVDTCGMGMNGIVKSGPGRTGYQAYDEAVTQSTVDWLNDSNKPSDKPFLLTVGYVTPHCPFVAPPEDFEYYRDKISVSDLPKAEENLHPRNAKLRKGFGVDPAPPVDAQWRTRVAYYGLTTFLDRQVGEVLNALEQSGQAENTIIVYCSDHGETLGEHGLWWKSTFYDGSSRIPLIVSWPGHIQPSQCRTETSA
jgi:choline-sulfatase